MELQHMSNIKFLPGRIEIIYNENHEELIETRFNGVDEWIIRIQNKKLTQLETSIIELNETSNKKPKIELPNIREIIDYITSKSNFEHDNAELQEHFLGTMLNSRDDHKTYFAFDSRIRNAKEKIAKTHKGNWESHETRELGTKKRVKVFTFEKLEDQLNIEE